MAAGGTEEKRVGQNPEMEQISNLLHLTFHRNKNQHRQARWWKWFAMLRRTVNKLLLEQKMADRTRIIARLDYMREIIIPRCHA